MKTVKRITKNTMFMFSANVFKKIITLLITLVVARYLGVDNFGKLFFAISFVALFIILTDFGAKILINREIARNKDKVNKYISNVLILKVFASILMLISVVIMGNVLAYPKETLLLVYIASFIQIFQSLGEPFNSAFRGFEKLEYNALSIISQNSLRLILAFLVVFLELGVKELLYAYLLAEILGFLIRFLFYHFKIHKFKFEWDLNFSKNLLKSSIPFGMAALSMTLYDKIDITMLSKLVANPDTVIGLYSAAYSLTFVFEFIPMSIGAAVYPYASIAFLKAIDKFKLIYRKLLSYYFYFTIPLTVGTFFIAKKALVLVYGVDYSPATFALQILIFTVLFKFQLYGFGVILNSMNKEMITMKATISSLAMNIILNFLLIPKYSYIGASIATVASEMVYFIIAYITVSIHLERVSLLKILYKPISAALIMGLVIYLIRDANLFLIILLGFIIYTLLMFMFKAFPDEDINYAKRYVNSITKNKIFRNI